MKNTHLAIGAAALVLVGGGGAYLALSPSQWERDAVSAIKVGDYEDAVKIAKRGLVEKPGHRKLQGLFLSALALERAKDGAGEWSQYTVLNGAEHYLANLNTVGILSKNSTIWPSGKDRDKAVENAQSDYRPTSA